LAARTAEVGDLVTVWRLPRKAARLLQPADTTAAPQAGRAQA
jgi:hypothetical protein